jgi:hypothetical protein
MEPRFGHDFSRVRVHADARAADSARAVNALAYTVGRDVVFGGGQYVPQSAAGLRLIAHELVHVVQQWDTPPPQTGHSGSAMACLATDGEDECNACCDDKISADDPRCLSACRAACADKLP